VAEAIVDDMNSVANHKSRRSRNRKIAALAGVNTPLVDSCAFMNSFRKPINVF